MSFTQALSEDRRGIVLRVLDEAPGYRLSESSLRTVLDHHGHMVSSDEVRAELEWLKRAGLVFVEAMPLPQGGELRIARLLSAGQEVARGLPHPGVRRQAAAR